MSFRLDVHIQPEEVPGIVRPLHLGQPGIGLRRIGGADLGSRVEIAAWAVANGLHTPS